MSLELSPSNSILQSTHVFRQQQLLHTIPRDPEAEQLALTYLNKKAPDLVAMILGGVL